MTEQLSPQQLLRLYDQQLRGHAEVSSMDEFQQFGPLWRAKRRARGFVTYQTLGNSSGARLDELIKQTVAFYAADPQIRSFEWKTRGHDQPTDLSERLLAHGFVPEEEETVMVGEAAALAQSVKVPAGVTLRRIDNVPDPYPELLRAAAAQARAFGFPFGVEDFVNRLERNGANLELWIAEAEGEVLCTGRLELVPGTEFAGLWGGGTVPEWRGKGLYRALTAARARSAMNRGVRYLQSDCTEFSRPILQRSGLLPITTTTPFIWRR